MKSKSFVSISDWLWFAGYGFLSAHLFTVISSIHSYIRRRVILMVSVISGTICCLQYPSFTLFIWGIFFSRRRQHRLYCLTCYCRLSNTGFDFDSPFWYNTNKPKKRLSTFYSLGSYFIVLIDQCYSRWWICAWLL